MSIPTIPTAAELDDIAVGQAVIEVCENYFVHLPAETETICYQDWQRQTDKANRLESENSQLKLDNVNLSAELSSAGRQLDKLILEKHNISEALRNCHTDKERYFSNVPKMWLSAHVVSMKH